MGPGEWVVSTLPRPLPYLCHVLLLRVLFKRFFESIRNDSLVELVTPGLVLKEFVPQLDVGALTLQDQVVQILVAEFLSGPEKKQEMKPFFYFPRTDLFGLAGN